MNTRGNTALAAVAAQKTMQFGEYEIIETIGEGGMGIVYRAYEPALDRDVAIKVLRDDLRGHKTLMARFKREGQAVASLNHPNIVHIYSVGSVEGIPYIAMEYVGGESLAGMMRREARMEWRQVLRIAEQVAEALAAAHQGMIIHRDIKPGNILVDRAGKAFVTDFGIAKVLTAETQLTLDGARLGTPQYMSPERCRGQATTASSDIYSLGILVFQLITGRLPFEGHTPVSLVRKIVSEPPARIREFEPDIPEDVERLVAYMIEKNPKDRPPNATALARIIARVREGKGLMEDPPGMLNALEEFRGGLPTPTPHAFSPVDGKRLLPHTSPFGAVSSRWRRLSARWRLALPAALLLLVGLALGEYGSAALSSGYLLDGKPRSEAELGNWRQPSQVAAFEDESPGVIIAPLSLPNFQIAGGVWRPGGALVAELRGVDRTPRAGQAAFVSLDPFARTASLSMPPVPSGGGNAYLRLLPASLGPSADGFLFQWREWDPELLVLREEGGRRSIDTFLSLSPSTQAMDGFALKADGTSAAIGLSATGGPNSWVLVEQAVSAPGRLELAGPGPRISWIEYSRDGDKVFFVRDSEDGPALWRADSGNASGAAALDCAGRFDLSSGAVSGDGSSLVVASYLSPKEPLLRIIDSETGELRSEIGSGSKAAWHPSDAYIVAIARDRKGASQIWAVSTTAPHERRQLTFLDQGVAPMLGVSRDGGHAFSAVAGRSRPTLVIVDLPDVF